MTSLAKKAYTESIDMVESHQVTLDERDQYAFIFDLHEVLTDKLRALREGKDYDPES
jgi:hypothetical protein